MRWVVFTAVFGTYRNTQNIPVEFRLPALPAPRGPFKLGIGNTVTFVAIVGDKTRVKGGVDPRWRVLRLPEDGGVSPRLQSRHTKLVGYQGALRRARIVYDATLWVDANVTLLPRVYRELTELSKLAQLGDMDVAMLRHPSRACTYQEIEACYQGGMDVDVSRFRRQRTLYRKLGFPTMAGLGETRVLVRVRSRQTREFEDTWATLFARFGHARDQCSVMVALWACHARWRLLDWERTVVVVDRVLKHRNVAGVMVRRRL